MADRYLSFADLGREKRLGIDYSIQVLDRGSRIVVLAPHGGKIEPYTSQLSALIAGDDLSLYCFEGCQETSNFTHLHITSHRFDEPMALELIGNAGFVFAVHGHGATESQFVMTGGGNSNWEARTAESLSDAGFEVREPTEELSGKAPSNICNRGGEGPGVQIEVSRALRDALRDDISKQQRFVAAVRAVLHEWSRVAST